MKFIPCDTCEAPLLLVSMRSYDQTKKYRIYMGLYGAPTRHMFKMRTWQLHGCRLQIHGAQRIRDLDKSVT